MGRTETAMQRCREVATPLDNAQKHKSDGEMTTWPHCVLEQGPDGDSTAVG